MIVRAPGKDDGNQAAQLRGSVPVPAGHPYKVTPKGQVSDSQIFRL